MKPSLILVHILLAVFLCGCSSKPIAIESDDVWKTVTPSSNTTITSSCSYLEVRFIIDSSKDLIKSITVENISSKRESDLVEKLKQRVHELENCRNGAGSDYEYGSAVYDCFNEIYRLYMQNGSIQNLSVAADKLTALYNSYDLTTQAYLCKFEKQNLVAAGKKFADIGASQTVS